MAKAKILNLRVVPIGRAMVERSIYQIRCRIATITRKFEGVHEVAIFVMNQCLVPPPLSSLAPVITQSPKMHPEAPSNWPLVGDGKGSPIHVRSVRHTVPGNECTER